jgi:hypothetical protein
MASTAGRNKKGCSLRTPVTTISLDGLRRLGSASVLLLLFLSGFLLRCHGEFPPSQDLIPLGSVKPIGSAQKVKPFIFTFTILKYCISVVNRNLAFGVAKESPSVFAIRYF